MLFRSSVSVAGVDVRDFDLTYLRQCVGVVTQEAYLFNGTILDNLRYAKEDATQEEIEQACKVANIHDFIVSQPNGYLTEVGNRGLKLSGGEKQRLSLARVVLKDPKILILDEATSALDSISENAIQEALEQLMVGRTSIVIAHRLSTILKADRIMVVKGGVIAEQGTHDELLEAAGVYRELYETQFRQVIQQERGAAEKHDLDIGALSTELTARELDGSNLTDVLMLMRSNRQYYRRLGERPNKAQLTSMVASTPDEVAPKHLVGFYDDEDGLVAVMDLTCEVPDESSALIGWFMVAADKQRQGVGSALFADVRAALSAQGYRHLELRIPEAAEEALAFWDAQGFKLTGERDDSGNYPVVTLARDV